MMHMRSTIPIILAAIMFSFGCGIAFAQLPDGLKCKTFYDTTKVRFDGIMWFQEIPGKPGYFLVAEQNGKIWTFHPATAEKSLYMNFPAVSQVAYHEDGLLGLAFHPRFRENRQIYAYYSPAAKSSELDIGMMTSDTSFLKDSGTPLKVIWSMPMMGSHNGSTVAFGPDGFLYWAKGQDHGMQGTAQDLKSTRGKMFRIDVDHPEGGKAYRIPPDNPFADRTDGTLKEIWANGLRNPMKFAFDALTGELWETEVGQWHYEDVNLIHGGDNLGWDIVEGYNCYTWNDEYEPLPTCDRTKFKAPLWAIPHIKPTNPWGNSGTGGLVYRANAGSKFYGAYLVGDFCSKQMFALTQKDGKMTEVKEYAHLPLGPSHFSADSDGNVYFAGWYRSSDYLSTDRSCQILMLDHPELHLGAASVHRNLVGRLPHDSRRLAVRLDGIPVAYSVGRDKYGNLARAYFADGSKR